MSAPTFSSRTAGSSPFSLTDSDGERKYLTAGEREEVLQVARKGGDTVAYSLCLVLAYTGCRLSEALALTAQRLDFTTSTITMETLKQRRGRVVFRPVPVPDWVLHELDLIHGIRAEQQAVRRGNDPYRDGRLFRLSRTTAWRRIAACMEAAGITGPKACPKGFRHAFGVTAATSAGIHMARRWMGHVRLETTTIYAEAQGQEAKDMVERMWGERK